MTDDQKTVLDKAQGPPGADAGRDAARRVGRDARRELAAPGRAVACRAGGVEEMQAVLPVVEREVEEAEDE
ncbi:hypothetical protein FTUN_5981 [Frigoriglobus tundricola]|uniref:Uncharacterized protein n=1 Tax=Frigoriglobus tundricola TaxID=2774151 RepID=A0A6M5YYR6_9BACT|nr:hypothetical protein FTUN_5981 [Frigoriglobus tundricola]